MDDRKRHARHGHECGANLIFGREYPPLPLLPPVGVASTGRLEFPDWDHTDCGESTTRLSVTSVRHVRMWQFQCMRGASVIVGAHVVAVCGVRRCAVSGRFTNAIPWDGESNAPLHGIESRRPFNRYDVEGYSKLL